MIVTLQDTTSSAIGAQLVHLREEGGAVALGRVLTLVIVTDGGDIEGPVRAANQASREHPCRVIVVAGVRGHKEPGLDAEIRLGGDAGASEVIILHPRGPGRHETDTLISALLLSDAPIVVWWPYEAPNHTGESPVGKMAERRITDVSSCADPLGALEKLAKTYEPGDTDLGWARTTLWRALVAAVLDETGTDDIESVTVHGGKQRPSVRLLAGWFASNLDVPVRVENVTDSKVIDGITVMTGKGAITLRRPPLSGVVEITTPQSQTRHVAVPIRTLQDCLMEDLRRLDPDTTYELALTQGLQRIDV